MPEQPGLSDKYRKSSPWPLLIALGLPLSEIGIILGLYPIAVGGLVLLLGSVAGILRETEYVASPWPVFTAMAAALVVTGIAIYYVAGGGTAGGDWFAVGGGGIAMRGLSIATAGVLALIGAAIVRSRIRAQPGV